MKKLAIYVHIPFCKQKCLYCDFNSFANKEELIEEYVKALCKEIEHNNCLTDKYEVSSIYIGGGTPSYIESKNIGTILKNIYSKYSVNENAETTIEVNPGTLTLEKLKDYLKFGINRVSFGVQASQDEMLKKIGRIHTYKEFLDNFYLARELGFHNISVDLMFGLPGQSLKNWKDTLHNILMLAPEHISAYSLKVEDKTKFGELLSKGELLLPSEENEREMYYILKDTLKQYKYIQYEISNFAQNGCESNHNLAYWNRQDYLGLGSNSASCIDDIRFSNEENIEKYINLVKNNDSPIVYKEVLTEDDIYIEKIILGLRLTKGINEKTILRNQGQEKKEMFMKNKKELLEVGLIEQKNGKIFLTGKGLDLANQVFVKFMEI